MNFTDDLLHWYDRHKRDLPWRGSRDPYIIWVSEIIFQQTRIDQGTAYFLRFAGRFPTVCSLAAASDDEVLRLWQGLGYYARARNMLIAAKEICHQKNGVFPHTFQDLIRMKGVGDYTASCIASICFNQPHAAVDGNVYRVLSRLYADHTPVDAPAGRKRFKDLASRAISYERPGDFNEAMMDLGATVCKPRNPDCDDCPLNNHCEARKRNLQSVLPVKSGSIKRSQKVLNYLLIRSEKGIFIQKRASRGVWAGLYELPLVAGDLDMADLAAECVEQYGIETEGWQELNRLKHQLTHAELEIRFFRTESVIPAASAKNWISIHPAEMDRYPFPKPLVDFLSSQMKE